jgi:hypothetical protein
MARCCHLPKEIVMEFKGRMLSSTVIPAAVMLALGVAGAAISGGGLVSREVVPENRTVI